ncbi:MAG TPA: NAD(P)H-dependent glycerol-3-phosphate dehydrogenase [Polyangia bacterium]|jgi:glycerol-3-phosphate dehydrogenase (NAD(P)+)|nr:NAD(P)H-dependent glycerol-3-phosphate dehydrogenase [Polyangia bacterium]
MKIGVLGGGAWGTVLATLASGRGHDVALWEFDPRDAAALTHIRASARTVPDFRLPDAVAVTNDVSTAVRGRELVVVVVPSETVRAALVAARAAFEPGAVVVCASKGLEPETRLTMAGVIGEILPAARVALLSGPSFAQEIAAGLPAALVSASTDPRANEAVVAALGSERFRIYRSDDVTGVAVGGALKNVLAIAVGCCDGFGFGLNARAALMTRGLAEMSRLAVKMGAHPLTLSGLAGFGDLVLTCTGELSRNRQVGLALARGETVPAIVASLGHVAEGIGTARTASTLADELGVDLPITREVAAVLHAGKTARAGVTQLLARDPGPERS